MAREWNGFERSFVSHVKVFGTFLLLLAVELSVAKGEDEPDQTGRAASLRRMQEKANEFTVSRLSKRDARPRLRTTPLLRYNDVPNGYRDASVWVWELDGFPIALAKVEDYSQRGWQYCVASLAPDAILVSRPGQKAWQSKGPGVTFQKIADVHPAINTSSRRLQLMKSAARRFGGKFELGGTGNREKMRPLTSPIHRFSSPEMGLIDGTIFVFAVSGTNPTALVVITIRDDDDDPKQRRCEYGVIGMTSDSASIYLDDQLVWSKKANYSKRFYDNWYFHLQPKPNVESGSLD